MIINNKHYLQWEEHIISSINPFIKYSSNAFPRYMLGLPKLLVKLFFIIIYNKWYALLKWMLYLFYTYKTYLLIVPAISWAVNIMCSLPVHRGLVMKARGGDGDTSVYFVIHQKQSSQGWQHVLRNLEMCCCVKEEDSRIQYYISGSTTVICRCLH